MGSYTYGYPPVPPYIGCSYTTCHLLKTKAPICCLELCNVCSHSQAKQAKDYNWKNKALILAAECYNFAMYNFIAPLRSHSLKEDDLSPIVFMLENNPPASFLEVIRCFPLVYWMKGSIDK